MKAATGDRVVPVDEVTFADDTLLNQLESEDANDPSTGWNKKTDFNDPSKGYSGTLHAKSVQGYSNHWTRSDITFYDQKIET